MSQSVADKVRKSAVYFVEGMWPEVIFGQVPKGVCREGQSYIVAIIPTERLIP